MKKIILSPEYAKYLLENNYPHNRKINKRKVNEYATDIMDGTWNKDVSFADPIIISDKGRLMNGQHRCSAVIVANKSIPATIEEEVKEELFRYLDGGYIRKASDFYNGTNTTTVVTLARLYYALHYGELSLKSTLSGKTTTMYGRVVPISRDKLLSTIDDKEDYFNKLIVLGRMAGRYLPKNKTSMFAKMFMILDFCECGESNDRFAEELGNRMTTNEIIAIYRMALIKTDTNKNRLSDEWFFGATFQAYDSFNNDRTLKSINKASLYYEKLDSMVQQRRNKERGIL